ncbi:MAG: hypothetical protein JWP59_3 [Massilia sp.]|nr:hypothetical protein [Massilia sp.]
MVVGSTPCTLAILLLVSIVANREAGEPAGGDALGLMMISLMAYAIALLSFAAGLIYFSSAVLVKKLTLPPWQWFCIAYSFAHVIVPIIYFSTR